MKGRKQTRRRFLKMLGAGAAAGAALPCVVPSLVLGGKGRVAPSDRITIGCIGVGNQGAGVMRNFLGQDSARVVAVCDVNARRQAVGKDHVNRRYGGSGCAVYRDFRELLARDDIDAVLVATPDHWHVLIALAAVRAGKDVYLEKPIGVSIAEAQALRAAVRRYGAVFQFGTQQRSNSRFRLACELVRNGRIGKVHTVNVWSPGSRSGGSLEVVPAPKEVDYDMWVGPAPFSPHTRHRCTNRFAPGDPGKIWPFISDYCVGWISGWGIHPLDVAMWGVPEGLSGPLEISGKGVFPADGVCDTATDWDVAVRCDTGVTLNFTGQPAPGEWRRRYGRGGAHGTAFEGTEGWVQVDRGGTSAHPKTLLRSAIARDEIHLYRSTSHVKNFLDCIRTRADTISPIDAAVAVDTLCQISAIAVRLQRRLKWNPANERFDGDQTANGMLTRAMRSPWHL